ncbi:hypothetical protein AB205_0202670 [Aquarana catesbeiana]|uniref:Uncharacterized protein n=1 Tax=Aquarana catesbeiana TaxID=8400 RepID=A0A2G9Q3V8_AQUCT|nr:hypothetical protein AB205_0202670 [Aquarana catesbeiana]
MGTLGLHTTGGLCSSCPTALLPGSACLTRLSTPGSAVPPVTFVLHTATSTSHGQRGELFPGERVTG